MKTRTLILLFILASGLFFACQKDRTNNATLDYYITFNFDGTPIEYSSTDYQGHASRSSWISINGGILKPNLINSSASESIYVRINMDEDSLTYNELQNMIGEELKVCSPLFTLCNAKHIKLDYDDGTNSWSTDKNNNTSPIHYLQINTVEYSPTVRIGVSRLVIVEGEFNLVLNNNSGETKRATNGKFRLQFPQWN